MEYWRQIKKIIWITILYSCYYRCMFMPYGESIPAGATQSNEAGQEYREDMLESNILRWANFLRAHTRNIIFIGILLAITIKV